MKSYEFMELEINSEKKSDGEWMGYTSRFRRITDRLAKCKADTGVSPKSNNPLRVMASAVVFLEAREE